MSNSGRKPTPFEREVGKRRLIVEILILVFLVLIGIMVSGLINTAIKAANYAKMTPTPTPSPYVRVTRTPTPTITPIPTPGPVVMIDAGHGGYDPGTLSKGVYEKDIALSIALKTRDKLEELGFTVLMTRTEDVFVSLSDRRKAYNSSEATALVSIHLNSVAPPDVTSSGCEVYTTDWKSSVTGERSSAFSKDLAQCIVDKICTATGARNRGTKVLDLEVLQSPKPAVLAEVGFITSETEFELLTDDAYRDKVAQGIVDGLVEYYKIMNGADRQNEQ